ncbi:hypothetical protein IAU60_001665 [Kwoniella sp. DSM 27419]
MTLPQAAAMEAIAIVLVIAAVAAVSLIKIVRKSRKRPKPKPTVPRPSERVDADWTPDSADPSAGDEPRKDGDAVDGKRKARRQDGSRKKRDTQDKAAKKARAGRDRVKREERSQKRKPEQASSFDGSDSGDSPPPPPPSKKRSKRGASRDKHLYSLDDDLDLSITPDGPFSVRWSGSSSPSLGSVSDTDDTLGRGGGGTDWPGGGGGGGASRRGGWPWTPAGSSTPFTGRSGHTPGVWTRPSHDGDDSGPGGVAILGPGSPLAHHGTPTTPFPHIDRLPPVTPGMPNHRFHHRGGSPVLGDDDAGADTDVETELSTPLAESLDMQQVAIPDGPDAFTALSAAPVRSHFFPRGIGESSFADLPKDDAISLEPTRLEDLIDDYRDWRRDGGEVPADFAPGGPRSSGGGGNASVDWDGLLNHPSPITADPRTTRHKDLNPIPLRDPEAIDGDDQATKMPVWDPLDPNSDPAFADIQTEPLRVKKGQRRNPWADVHPKQMEEPAPIPVPGSVPPPVGEAVRTKEPKSPASPTAATVDAVQEDAIDRVKAKLKLEEWMNELVKENKEKEEKQRQKEKAIVGEDTEEEKDKGRVQLEEWMDDLIKEQKERAEKEKKKEKKKEEAEKAKTKEKEREASDDEGDKEEIKEGKKKGDKKARKGVKDKSKKKKLKRKTVEVVSKRSGQVKKKVIWVTDESDASEMDGSSVSESESEEDDKAGKKKQKKKRKARKQEKDEEESELESKRHRKKGKRRVRTVESDQDSPLRSESDDRSERKPRDKEGPQVRPRRYRSPSYLSEESADPGDRPRIRTRKSNRAAGPAQEDVRSEEVEGWVDARQPRTQPPGHGPRSSERQENDFSPEDQYRGRSGPSQAKSSRSRPSERFTESEVDELASFPHRLPQNGRQRDAMFIRHDEMEEAGRRPRQRNFGQDGLAESEPLTYEERFKIAQKRGEKLGGDKAAQRDNTRSRAPKGVEEEDREEREENRDERVREDVERHWNKHADLASVAGGGNVSNRHARPKGPMQEVDEVGEERQTKDKLENGVRTEGTLDQQNLKPTAQEEASTYQHQPRAKPALTKPDRAKGPSDFNREVLASHNNLGVDEESSTASPRMQAQSDNATNPASNSIEKSPAIKESSRLATPVVENVEPARNNDAAHAFNTTSAQRVAVTPTLPYSPSATIPPTREPELVRTTSPAERVTQHEIAQHVLPYDIEEPESPVPYHGPLRGLPAPGGISDELPWYRDPTRPSGYDGGTTTDDREAFPWQSTAAGRSPEPALADLHRPAGSRGELRRDTEELERPSTSAVQFPSQTSERPTEHKPQAVKAKNRRRNNNANVGRSEDLDEEIQQQNDTSIFGHSSRTDSAPQSGPINRRAEGGARPHLVAQNGRFVHGIDDDEEEPGEPELQEMAERMGLTSARNDLLSLRQQADGRALEEESQVQATSLVRPTAPLRIVPKGKKPRPIPRAPAKPSSPPVSFGPVPDEARKRQNSLSGKAPSQKPAAFTGSDPLESNGWDTDDTAVGSEDDERSGSDVMRAFQSNDDGNNMVLQHGRRRQAGDENVLAHKDKKATPPVRPSQRHTATAEAQSFTSQSSRYQEQEAGDWTDRDRTGDNPNNEGITASRHRTDRDPRDRVQKAKASRSQRMRSYQAPRKGSDISDSETEEILRDANDIGVSLKARRNRELDGQGSFVPAQKLRALPFGEAEQPSPKRSDTSTYVNASTREGNRSPSLPRALQQDQAHAVLTSPNEVQQESQVDRSQAGRSSRRRGSGAGHNARQGSTHESREAYLPTTTLGSSTPVSPLSPTSKAISQEREATRARGGYTTPAEVSPIRSAELASGQARFEADLTSRAKTRYNHRAHTGSKNDDMVDVTEQVNAEKEEARKRRKEQRRAERDERQGKRSQQSKMPKHGRTDLAGEEYNSEASSISPAAQEPFNFHEDFAADDRSARTEPRSDQATEWARKGSGVYRQESDSESERGPQPGSTAHVSPTKVRKMAAQQKEDRERAEAGRRSEDEKLNSREQKAGYGGEAKDSQAAARASPLKDRKPRDQAGEERDPSQVDPQAAAKIAEQANLDRQEAEAGRIRANLKKQSDRQRRSKDRTWEHTKANRKPRGDSVSLHPYGLIKAVWKPFRYAPLWTLPSASILILYVEVTRQIFAMAQIAAGTGSSGGMNKRASIWSGFADIDLTSSWFGEILQGKSIDPIAFLALICCWNILCIPLLGAVVYVMLERAESPSKPSAKAWWRHPLSVIGNMRKTSAGQIVLKWGAVLLVIMAFIGSILYFRAVASAGDTSPRMEGTVLFMAADGMFIVLLLPVGYAACLIWEGMLGAWQSRKRRAAGAGRGEPRWNMVVP